MQLPAARAANSGPPSPATSHVRRQRAQLARERAGVQIAGRLAARQQDSGRADGQEAGRLNSAGLSGALIVNVGDAALEHRLARERGRSCRNATCTPSTGR